MSERDSATIDALTTRLAAAEERAAELEAEREKANGFAERSKASAEKWAGEANDLDDRIAAMQDENQAMRAVIDRLIAPDTWRFADGSEVGVPEGTFIRSGISANPAARRPPPADEREGGE